MNQNLLTVRDISKSFKTDHVLSQLNLSVEAGEVICILGESAKGKSTLFDIICGLQHADKGEVLFNQPLDYEYVFQDDVFLPWKSTRENILFPSLIKGKNINQAILESTITSLNLESHLDKEISELSGGTKRRVSLARALVFDPLLLILDEPFRGLDFKLKKNAIGLINEIMESFRLKSIVFSTHSLETALSFSTKLFRFNDHGSLFEIDIQREYKDRISSDLDSLFD